MKIAVISGSMRPKRQSHKIAVEIVKRLKEQNDIEPILLDIKEKPLPLLESTYKSHPSPTDNMHWWKEQLDQAHGIIIVSPEYNSSFSGPLKNTLDYFFEEYKGKPMAIATASSGVLGGIHAAHALQQFCLKVGGILQPAFLIGPKVQTLFDESGQLTDETYATKLNKFLTDFASFCQKHG